MLIRRKGRATELSQRMEKYFRSHPEQSQGQNQNKPELFRNAILRSWDREAGSNRLKLAQLFHSQGEFFRFLDLT
jgi:hypothetical protein